MIEVYQSVTDKTDRTFGRHHNTGDYKDFYELVESIYRITGLDDQTEIYYGIKNRLLGICYDI